MANINITQETNSNTVRSSGGGEGLPIDPWVVDCRDAAANNRTVVSTNLGVHVQNTYNGFITTRRCSRYFMTFNTSAITETVQSATLYLYSATGGSNAGLGDIMPVKATAPAIGNNLLPSNYNSIFQYQPGFAMDNNSLGNVVDYADTPKVGTSTTWNAIPLNAAARTDINSLNQFSLALVNYTYDYLYQNPAVGTNVDNDVRGASGFPNYLEITTGLNQYVLSVNPAATAEVNNVPEFNIKFVNRIVPPDAIEFYRSALSTANANCIMDSPAIPIYAEFGINTPNQGIVYTNSGLTTVFNGGGQWWNVHDVPNVPYGRDLQLQISSQGVILNRANPCLF